MTAHDEEISRKYSDKEIEEMYLSGEIPREYSDEEIEEMRIRAEVYSEADKLFDMLKDVSARIDATGSESTELDILLMEKKEVEDQLDQANITLANLEAQRRKGGAYFSPSESTTFVDIEDEPASKLSPLVKRVNEMARKAHFNNEAREEQYQQAGMRQLNLFVADLLDYNLKDDTATMEAPLFSLSTKPDMETWKWVSQDKKKWLEVTPSSIGRATIHDKDLLIYLTSQLAAAMNIAARGNTKMPGRRIRFTLHDFLIATGRDTSGKAYSSVESTLDRLSGTRLKTNMEMGNIDRRSSFGLIERADYIIETDSKGNKRMTSIEVTLSEWLYRALEQKNILTITPHYFTLRKPLEKRLYELARKHVGEQAEWIIKEDNLLEKTGSRANIREFRRMLAIIIADDSIPDYRMAIFKSESGENMVHFYPKKSKKLTLAYSKNPRATSNFFKNKAQN